MVIRIKSKQEFIDRVDMACQIQDKWKAGIATQPQIDSFSVMMDEIREYKEANPKQFKK